jgi:hypothetical protein
MRVRFPSSPSTGHRPLSRWLVAVGLLAVAVAGPVGGALPHAAAAPLPERVSWTAEVNDVNVRRTSSEVVELDPARPADVVVRVENPTDQPVDVPFVRLEGVVLGLAVYSFTTRVDLVLPPGGADERAFPVPLLDLGRQANGLIPSHLALLDERARVLASTDFTVDVLGEADSVYSLFGLAIGALALLRLAVALWRLSTGRLHPNRWRRGMTLAGPGLGLGFLVTFSLSALRITSPEGGLWASLLLGGAAVGFLAGYLTPTPGDEEEPDDDGPGRAGDEEEPPEDVPEPVAAVAADARAESVPPGTGAGRDRAAEDG